MKNLDKSNIKKEDFMSYKNKEEKYSNPLFKIIKQEYSLMNVFLIIFNMLFMGFFSDFMKENDYKESLYKVLFSISFVVFLLNVLLFIKRIIKDMKSVSLPTSTRIIFQIIQVLIFILILVTMNKYFEIIYTEHIVKYSKYFQK
jgi:uncharacterized membrane protein YhhN